VVAARVAAERAAFRRGAAFAFYAFARASRGAPSSPVLAKVVVSGLEPGGARVGQLGYWVDGDEEGKGLAREAVLAVVRFAFEEAGVTALEAAVAPSNTRSVRLAERCGFRPTSELRHLGPKGREVPHVVLGLLAEDWLYSG
jgi:RimJ/RimL family protein N-acetyltransferase